MILVFVNLHVTRSSGGQNLRKLRKKIKNLFIQKEVIFFYKNLLKIIIAIIYNYICFIVINYFEVISLKKQIFLLENWFLLFYFLIFSKFFEKFLLFILDFRLAMFYCCFFLSVKNLLIMLKLLNPMSMCAMTFVY